MKKLIILFFILIFITACGRKAKPEIRKKHTSTSKQSENAVFLTRNVPPKLIQKGSEASQKLAETLRDQLLAAMQEQGLKGALAFCSSNAQKLTEDVNLSYQGLLNVKRTSLNFRNPADKPDRFEKQALLLLKKNIAANGTPPDYLIQKITGNGQTRYRYYKPILIGSTCLGCHGKEKMMEPDILKEIRKNYPEGTATGYRKGQLRGVIRVEMRASSVISNP